MHTSKKQQYALPRDYRPVGEFLREQRVAKGLTQREVSLELGYSSSQFISNFECGIAVPPLNKMKSLVKIYALDVDALIKLVTECEAEVMRKVIVPRRGRPPKSARA